MILISLVRYGSSQSIVDMVESARSCGRVRFSIADNGPGIDEQVQALEGDASVSCVVTLSDNPGYFPGAFAAARAAILAGDEPDWIVVSNSDLDIPWDEFLAMLQAHERADRVVVAPSVLDMPGEISKNPHLTDRPTSRRVRRVWLMARYGPTFRLYQMLSRVRSRLAAKTPRRGAADEATQRVYAAHGSIVALRRSVFDVLEPHSHEAVLFSEEIWLAEMCDRLSIPVVYDGGCVVRHFAHGSTGGINHRRRQLLWKRGSRAALDFHSGQLSLTADLSNKRGAT